MRSSDLSANNDTAPPVPTGTMTRFGMVWPAWSTFRFDTTGWPDPVGHAVTNPGWVVSVAVRFSATATAPAVGMPPRPATWTSIAELSPSVDPPRPDLVSRMRLGARGTN